MGLKVLYIGNVLSKAVVDKHKLSIAGKKYELSLLNSLNNILHDNLEIISISRVPGANLKYQDTLFNNKKYKILHQSRYFLLSELVLSANLIFELLIWVAINYKHNKSILLLNSPFGASFFLVCFKYLFGIKIFSLTIDTPFIRENKFNSILGIYTKIKFKLGHYLLHFFSGIAILNYNVVKVLNLKIPFLVTKIGYDPYEVEANSSYHKQNDKYKILYIGTLMKYKGVDILMDAVSKMNPEIFELILCGDGPYANEVLAYSKTYPNIIYKGRISNSAEIKKLQKNADLLVNITQIGNTTENFGCNGLKILDRN